MKRILFIALFGWLLVNPASAAPDPATLIKLSMSVLKVEAIRVQGGYSLGSGVVVAADRVVTNCHVTRDARQIAVLLNGLRLPAQSQRVDAYHDLCLLRVRGVDGARAVEFARTDKLTIGQALTAVGHTAGVLHSSAGEVVALHRMGPGRVIQSSTYFNSGASGGGLFDSDLRLVGILTFRLPSSRRHYFAMPAEWLADQLRNSEAEQPIAPRGADELAFWEKPLEAQPLFLRAAELEREGRWSALQPLAADWAHDDPSDPEPWYLLGLAFARQDRLPDARLAFECSLSLAPDLGRARAELQQVYQREGQASEPSSAPAACRL